MAERITVKRTADLTGMSQLTIRLGLKYGTLPFGSATKTSKNRTVYHISPNRLAEYLGIPVEEVKEVSNE